MLFNGPHGFALVGEDFLTPYWESGVSVDNWQTVRWNQTWRLLNMVDPPGLAELLTRYQSPGRAYHNLKHLEECFWHCDLVQEKLEQPCDVMLAIWYHDAVYDTHANDNEARSADLATEQILQITSDRSLAERVATLIRATFDHQGEGSDTAYFIDIDLGILAAPPDRFWEYESAIRQEYAWVAEDVFRRERAKILDRFLHRTSIYATEFFQTRWEQAARDNLTAAIARLR